MKIKGKAWKFGDDINTDEIIPAKYLNTTDHAELGRHCMEGMNRNFPKKVSKGDILAGGKNFGCGSSREHAPLAIKGCGISCIIAVSFARIFFRNCINIGIPIFESKEAVSGIARGDRVEVDTSTGTIKNLTRKKTYLSRALPEFMEKLIKAGGLMRWIRSMGSGLES